MPEQFGLPHSAAKLALAPVDWCQKLLGSVGWSYPAGLIASCWLLLLGRSAEQQPSWAQQSAVQPACPPSRARVASQPKNASVLRLYASGLRLVASDNRIAQLGTRSHTKRAVLNFTHVEG